ncbi:ankyrin repeat-containing domain protein, partial [Lasiosphaeria miniovina]
VDILLNLNFDLSRQDPHGKTPVLCCTANSLKDMLILLVKHGADITARDNMGNSIWHLAAAENSHVILRHLLATVDQPDRALRYFCGDEPILIHAATWGSEDVIVALLKAGAETNLKLEDGNTPLHSAIDGSSRMVRILLLRGADLNVQAVDGSTALDFAARFEQVRAAKALLEHGAKHNCEDSQGLTPLMYAYRTGLEGMISLFIGKESDPQAKSSSTNWRSSIALVTALEHAIEKGVDALIELGASLEDTDSLVCTPLHLAASKGQCDIIDRLVRAGALVNKRTLIGDTPLMAAAWAGQINVVRKL